MRAGPDGERLMKKRADLLLVDQGLVRSRSEAQALLLAGRVFHGEHRVDKAGTLLAEDTQLEIRGARRFVSRGGEKLEGALEDLGVNVSGLRCVDIGASTGGFTDCLLQQGAASVVAIDVGKGLLDPKLRADPRVDVREGVNARFLTDTDLEESPGLVVVDASFIGIGKLLPGLANITGGGAQLVALIKPQFEVGRAVAKRAKGVIRDPEVRKQAIQTTCAEIEGAGFSIQGGADSRVAGPKGNLEYFVWAVRGQT